MCIRLQIVKKYIKCWEKISKPNSPCYLIITNVPNNGWLLVHLEHIRAAHPSPDTWPAGRRWMETKMLLNCGCKKRWLLNSISFTGHIWRFLQIILQFCFRLATMHVKFKLKTLVQNLIVCFMHISQPGPMLPNLYTMLVTLVHPPTQNKCPYKMHCLLFHAFL